MRISDGSSDVCSSDLERSAKIRKIVVVVEETREEMGREISPPTRRAAALAVIANPFADRFQDDLEILMQIGAELGQLLGDKAVAALDVDPSVIESYGKAALVGEGGELEHARSEERRVGTECVCTCRSRWWPYP